MLKPQDIVILLKILSTMTLSQSYPKESLSQNRLATFLCMSVSEVNAGMKRLTKARLLELVLKDEKIIVLPNKPACEECLISGVKYFFHEEIGEPTRGIATSYAGPPLNKLISIGNDYVPVWPYVDGDQRGVALKPLYPSVPKSLIEFPDELFYEFLVLIDAIRSGKARERNIAVELLKARLNHDQKEIFRKSS